MQSTTGQRCRSGEGSYSQYCCWLRSDATRLVRPSVAPHRLADAANIVPTAYCGRTQGRWLQDCSYREDNSDRPETIPNSVGLHPLMSDRAIFRQPFGVGLYSSADAE